ncbi:CRISPR-associated protein Cas4 [Gloeothece citriformis PCC 7424]|uniref:CRISPR-associated exonuclease Cas4 n=1 Tax=Gloeothece citriformis (strain PCC 7424) TaxID=65393 RepID=B7KB42_GLOC7|nr:CRISPR-associated protein Cas4 [Gloeothece citriformis]ACK70152.1 CRISPR-associated protein Cas4 [Gloeothece citriformis PCC 7424]
MNDDYLPLAYLNAWEYCPRRFYWEYVLGEMADNEHILMGRYLHRNVNQEGISQEGDTLCHRQQWVWSDRLQVKGIIDLVEEREDQLLPVEYKKGRMAKHLNDYFQLCAAAICLEEKTGNPISYGEIFYQGNRRRQRVNFTDQLRQATEEAIFQAHRLVNDKMPPPINHSQKCRDCSLKDICLPKEVHRLYQGCKLDDDDD